MTPPRIADLVTEGALRHAERPAIRQGDRVVDYRALAHEVATAASWLEGVGVGPADRVLIVAENDVEALVLLFAAGRREAWPVLATAKLAAAEIDAICAHCEPRLALYATGSSDEAAAHAARRGAHPVEIGSSRGVRVERFAGGPTREAAPDGPAADVAVMLYTSGTTGAPRAAMLTHSNLLFLARTQSLARRYAPSDRVYVALPFAYAGALASIALSTLAAGGCLVLEPRFDPARLALLVRDDGITVVPGVPALHVKFAHWAREHDGAFAASRVRMVTSASSPLDAAVKADVEALFGLPLQNGYGLTETTAVVCQTRLDERRADTSVGRALPGVRVRFADARGADVPAGELGEILVQGPNVFVGYFRDPAATRAAFTADGWLRTGDLGRIDASGDVFVTGRLKDMIKRSGYTVVPAEVEAALQAHPATARCAVVGRPRGADEEVVAFVELKEGTSLAETSLRAFLARRLAAHKRPGVLRFVAQLPSLPNGKPDRRTLGRIAREDRDPPGVTAA
ncbi:MAG: class I adenylate-forming enzyme family protein [Betaproteobacteria bacterium]